MIRTAILTVSDSSVAGTRDDVSGPMLADHARQRGWKIAVTHVVPDEQSQIADWLRSVAGGGDIDLILTTGGTGVALRDVTPEATRSVIEREIPGLGELMRSEGRQSTEFSVLSRATAGTLGTTLIVNLPGSPKGAIESLVTVQSLIPHMVDLLQGKTGHGVK